MGKENNKAGYIPDKSIEELNEILRIVSGLSHGDLMRVLHAITDGLVIHRQEALERSVDMETAVAILAQRKVPKESSWKHIRDNLIKPYEKNLRAPQLMGSLDKRVGEPTKEPSNES